MSSHTKIISMAKETHTKKQLHNYKLDLQSLNQIQEHNESKSAMDKDSSENLLWLAVLLKNQVLSLQSLLLVFPDKERFHSRGQHLCKFIGTKESVYIRNEVNSHRFGLVHQHRWHFIVLEHQFGYRDVTWKRFVSYSLIRAYSCFLVLMT